jgi:hypothetical protein
MSNITGNFKGMSTMQSMITLHDVPEHQLMLTAGKAVLKTNDSHLNGAKHHAWGTADLIKGHGQQHGYFRQHVSNGDSASGTYECKVTTVNGQLTMEGTWKYTRGSGQFEGITGNGTFKGKMISPTEDETSFEGNYQMKAGTKAA